VRVHYDVNEAGEIDRCRRIRSFRLTRAIVQDRQPPCDSSSRSSRTRSLNVPVAASLPNVSESVGYCIAVTSTALVAIFYSRPTVAELLGVIGCWLY